MSAFSADYPLYTQSFRLCVYLGIQPFRHLVRGEEAEIAAFRGICAPGIIEAEFVEEHHIPHAGEGAGVSEEIARRGYKEYLRALPVERSGLSLMPVMVSMSSTIALDAVHDRMGFEAEVVALHIAVGHRA